MSPQPIFVIATQRSGTNFLRSILANTGKVRDFDEQFRFDEFLDDNNFFLFRRDILSKDPDRSLPTPENMEYLFLKYLDFLARNWEGKEGFLVDVKYNSVHHFNTIWQSPVQVPFLFRLLKKHEIPVIHIVRKNILKTHISYKISLENKKWVVGSGQKYQPQPVKLNPRNVINALSTRQSEISLFNRFCKSLPRCKKFFYEEFSDPEKVFPDLIFPELEKLTGINFDTDIEIATRKMVENHWEMVENFEELKAALMETQFAKFVND